MPDLQTTFDQLCQHVRETVLLESAASVLEWDERTNMPVAAGAYRAEQITYLSRLVHQRRTDRQLGEWLEQLASSPLEEPHGDRGTTIRQLKRDFDRRVKLPTELVERLTRASVLGQQAWVEARKNDDFASFAPHLKTIVSLKREQAEVVGYEQHPYDALLDDYEPDARTAQVAGVLAGLKDQLAPLVREIAESGRRPPLEILQRHYPADVQQRLGKQAAQRIGFDFQRGRLDQTAHPFCASLGPDDGRITTRYDEQFFSSGFFGILHEAGHGIYDQGLRPDWYGLPPGSYISLGIHESQSRMWENAVGRSRSFWQHFYPETQAAFPDALNGVPLDDFFFAINRVEPSLIRVEADEATYNLHIIVRFELEQSLVTGELAIDDLPEAWRTKYRDALGIEPPNDADGVLQDIHWSAALIGYFPTYSLGNLYMAQFFDTADEQLGGLDEQFARGEFEPLCQWLRTNIHEQGQRYTAAELVERVTGQPLHHAPLIASLRRKLEPLYGIRPGG